MPKKELKPKQEPASKTMTQRKVFTSYIIIGGITQDAIIKSSAFITGAYGIKSVKRMSFFNASATDIDNTGGEYFYDETYAVLYETVDTVEGDAKDQPALLCQLVTYKELTLDDLLAIQNNVKDDPLTILSRWHMKYEIEWPDGEKNNPMLHPCEVAGYLSVYNGETNKNIRIDENYGDLFEPTSDFFKGGDKWKQEWKHERIGDYPDDKNIFDFVQETGIEVMMYCPKCGERTSAADIHFKGACPNCATGFKEIILGKLAGAFDSLETSE